jgi:hypothetical protein
MQQYSNNVQLQIRLAKGVTGKFVFTKELRLANQEKPRNDRGLSFSSVSSIADGGKLLRHAIGLDWRGVWWFWGLTRFSGPSRRDVLILRLSGCLAYLEFAWTDALTLLALQSCG